MNSKEYRKPEWVTRMEEIQKRLSEQQQSAKFTQEIKEVRLKEGMKAKFEAHFAGNPKPEITWYYNNEPLKNSKNVQIKVKEIKTILTLIECSADMAGYYTCKIRNPLGSDSTRAGLTVNKSTGGVEMPSQKTIEKLVKSEEDKIVLKQKKKEEKKQKLEEVKAKAQKEIKTEKVIVPPRAPIVKKPKQVPEKTEEKINFSRVQLKKAVPIDKPSTAKPEPVQLKPTPPKASKPVEPPAEKVELKPVPKKIKEEVKVSPKIQIKLQHTTITPKRTSDTKDTQKTTEKINSNTTKITERVIKSESIQEVQIQKPQKFPTKRSTIIEIKGEELRKGQTYKPKVDDEHENKMLKDDDDIDYKPDEQKTIKSKKMKDMGSNLLEEQKQAEEDNISEPSILHEKELQEKCNKNKEIKVLKKKVIKKKVLKDEETSKKSTKIKNLKTADHAKPRVTESEDQIVSERPRESKTKKEDSSELSIKENIQAVDSQNVKDILTQTSLDNVTESKDINKEKHLSADTTSIKELVLKEPTEQRSEEISKPSECFGPEMKDKIEIVMKKSSSIDNQITELLDSTPLSQSTQELKEVVLTRLKELANKDQELSKLLPPQLESNQLKEIVLKQPKEIGDNSKEEFHRIKFSDRDMEELKEIVIKKSKEIENKTTSLANKERLKLEIEQAKEVVLKKIKQIQDEGVKLSKLKMPELTAEELKEIVMKKAKQIKEDVSDLKRSEQLKLETDDIREVVMKSSVDLGETITELPAYKSPELDTEEIKEISMKECKDELTKRKKLSTNRADRKKEVLPVKVKRLENDEVLELDSSSIQLKSEDLKEIVIKKPKQPEEDVVILQDNNKPYTSKIEEIKEVALKKAEEPINKSTVLSSIESPKPVTEELQEMVAKTTKQLDTKSVQLPSLKPFQSTSEEIVEVVAKKMDKKAVDLSGSKNTHFSSNEVKEIPVGKPGESEKEISKLSGSMTPEIAIKEIAMKKTRQIQNDTVDVLNAKLDEQEPKEMQEVVIKTPRQHEDSFTELSDSKAVTPETINLKEVIPEKKEKIRKDTPDKSSIKYNDDLDKVSEQSPLSLDSSAMKLDVTKKKIINKKSEQLVMEPMDIEKVLNQDELETKEMLEILIKKIKKGDSDSAKMIASVSKDINVKELEEIILRAIEDSHVEPTILSELKKNISSIDLKEIIYKKSNEISGTEADVQRVKKRILTEEELTEIPVEKREEGKLENQFKKSHLSSEESKRDVEKVSLTKEEVESTGKVHDEDMHILQPEEETLQISSKTSEESKTKKVVKKKGIKKIKTKKTPEGDQPQKTKSVDGNLDLPRKDDKGELVSDTSEGYDSSIFQLDDEIKRNVIDTVRKNSVKRNEELDSLSAEDRQAALKKDNLIKVEEKDVIMKKEKPMKKKKKKLSSKILENSESSRVDSTDEFTPDNTDTTKKELKAPTQAIMSDENLYTFDIKDETSTIKTTKIISASQEKLTEKEPTTKTEASKIDDIIQTDTVTNYIEPIKKSIKKQEKTTTDKTDKKIKETKQEDQKILEEKNETKEISEVPKSEDEKVKTTLKTKKKILKKVTQKDEAYLEESMPEKDEFTVEGKEIVLKSEQTSISEHVDEVSSLNEDVKPTEKSDSKPKKVVQLEKVADVKKLEEEKEQIKSAPSKKPEPSDKKLEVKDDRAVKKDDELRDKEKHEKSEPILDTSTPLQDNSTPMIEKSELEVTMLTEKSHPSSVNSIPILTEPTLAVEEPKLIIEEPKPIIEEPDSGSPKSKPKIFERKGEKSAPIVDEPKLVIKELQQDINVNEPTFDEPEPIIEEPTSKRKISRIAEEVKPSSEEAADAKITNINLKSEVEDTKVTKAEPDPITKQTQEEERQLPEPKKKSKDERPKLPQIEDDLLSSKKNESVSKTIKEVKKTKKIVKKKTEMKNEVEGEKQISEEKIRSEKVTTESLIDNQSTDVDITKKESSKIIKKSVEETRVVEEKTKSIVEDIKKIENGNEMVSSNITSEIQALEPNAVVTKDGESVEEITKVPESLQNKDTSKQKKQVRFIENDDHEIEPQIKIIEDDKVVRKVKKVKKMKKKEKKSHDDDNEDVETLIQDEVQAIVMKLVKRVIEKRPDSQSIFNEECVTDIPNADTLPVQVALLSICEKELLQPKVVSDVITQEVKNETMSSKNIGLKALFKIVQNDSAFYETLSSICVEPEYFNSDAIHTQLTKLRFQEALARGIQNVNEEIALLDAVTQEVSKQAVYQLFQKIQQGLTVSELDSSDTLLKIPGIDSEPAQMALMSICETYLQPNEILTTIPWEDRRGKENFLYNALGLKALKKTLEHCSVETLIQDFFVHPEYFSSDHILKQKAKLGGQEITCSHSKELSETVSIRSKKISSFNKAKAIVTRDLKEGNVVEESVDEMCLQSRIKSDRSSLPTQMALISICQNVLTPSAVEQIVSDESRSIDKGFEHVVGSRVLVKTLERVPIVESFSDYCVQPEYFTLETFKKQVAKYNIQESEILSVQNLPKSMALKEIPPEEMYKRAVRRLFCRLREGSTVTELIQSGETKAIEGLEDMPTQLALVSMCEDITTSFCVDEFIASGELLELARSPGSPTFGLAVLSKTLEYVPVAETLNDFYISPKYFSVPALQKQIKKINWSIEKRDANPLNLLSYEPIFCLEKSIHQEFPEPMSLIPTTHAVESLQLLEGGIENTVHYQSLTKQAKAQKVVQDTLQRLHGFETVTYETLLESGVTNEILQNIQAQMALVSLCESVLEASTLEQIIIQEQIREDESKQKFPEIGLRILTKTLEHVPLQRLETIFIHDSEYFTSPDLIQKQISKLITQESYSLSQIIPQEEASSYAPKKFLTSVASIVRDIKEGKSLEDIRAAFEMGTLFELESIESQMGLLSLAERLLTPSTVQEIVSEELESSGVKALSSIGLKPFVQGVEQTPLDVCSVLSGTKAEFFEKSAIKEKFAQLQSLAKEFSVQTSEEKVSIHDRVQEPAINAILNLNKLVKKERTVSEAISSISAEIFSDISSPEKQYGLLKTAHRISDAPLIQEMLLNEKTRSLITNESQENLGIKILAQTLEINPFGVEDIAPFCKALDFESFDKLETQSSLLLDFAELMNVTKAKEEVGILHEMQIEKALAKKAILSMSNGVKEGIPVSEMMVLYNSGEFPELFSPQSQCCMLTNAQKINSAACYKEVICCSTKDSKELREFETVGFRALMSALEESTISIEDSALCFDSLDYSEKKAKVQIAQILKEAAIIHVPKLKEESDSLLPLSSLATPSEISALFSYVEDIKYGKSVQEVFESYNPQNFPTLSTIESQMALLSTVERFKNVPVIKETVSQELVSSGGLSLKTVGTRALLDVVDETPADVNEILSYVSTQDMTPDNVKAKMARLLCVAGEANISQETSNVASEEYHGPMKAIADIALRLEHGASVEEVNAAFEAHEFPELESLGSQMAMIRVVERVGHSALINQVLLEEKGSELVAMPESKGRKISSQIGFRALMSTLSHEPYKTEEVITSFNPKDFVKEEVAMADYAKLVHDSKELKIAQTSEISTEIKESIDTEIKKASSSEVKSEMVTVEANKSATKISASQSVETAQVTSTSSDIGRPIIKEGDTFFALATFVSDTGEAMNLVEGEKVHVLEWNNNDWWYVKKHITEESGWVPAQYLKDEKTYTLYVQKKLVEKIEKLPVFEQPKEGEKTFSPKIITKVQSMNAVDGCQVEFSCQVEGNPRPQITWFRQTAIIKPSQDFQISYADDNVATLVIKEVFPEDAGTFTCVAKNCVGYASSSSDLTVERPLSDHGSFEKHDRRSLSRESSLADIVEGIPPTFAQRPQTKNAEEGTIAELECRFVAIPEAEVKWFHNKVELKNTNRLTIHHQADMHMYCSIVKILDVRSEDAGTYEVSAKNREGEASNTLVLNVTTKTISQEPPMIVKPLTPTVCKLNDSIKMEAVITGKPKPKLSWYHNGSELLQDETNVKITEKENIYALTISQVSQSHDGDYLIKASNEYGFAQTQANLCVQGQEITFIKPLEDVEIKERSSYEMFVEVSDEKANVKWQKDGQEIKSDDQQYKFKREGGKHYLIIHCATVHHEGEYVASVGEQECSCELTIIELPPEFTKSLTPCTLTSGETGMFEIELSKGDAVTRWFKHGLEIEFSQRVQLIIDGKKQKLQIYKADKRDAGEYSVTVGYKSCTAMLFVEEPKVSFVANLNKVTTGVLGQSVRLTVKLSKKDVNILWLKDGKQITEGPNYSFETDGCEQTIIISGATIQDVGQYTCVAENVKTTTELELAGEDVKLIILESDINREVTVNRGQDIILNVPYQETSQKPQIKWVFQGIELYSSEKTQIKTTRKEASLTIKHIQSIDCGMYTVKLWNSVSEVSVDFVLNIKDKPSPPRGPASVDWKSDDSMELLWNGPLSDGGSAVLEYIVERKEEGKKSWKQVGTSIHTRMEIRGLGKNISYNFRIIARNSVGNSDPFIVEEIVTATSSSSSTKKSLPGCPNVQVTDVTSKSVTLQWSPPVNNGGAELIEYVIEKKISTSHSWEKAATVDPSVTLYTIENLKEKCQYYFRVSAVNEVGAGEPTSTEIVSLRTHARPPSSPTAPLEINSIGPTAIMVEWGAPESDGGAPLEGYKVAVRDAKRHMWMEVGRVSAETQKLKVQDLAEGHEYFIRIFAKNEVGFSDPLENDEPLKVIRPADFKEEETIEKDKHEETPSLSFSTTETLSSWMREANMDADIQSYTTSSSLRRDEYFFRIWYYAKKLFK